MACREWSAAFFMNILTREYSILEFRRLTMKDQVGHIGIRIAVNLPR